MDAPSTPPDKGQLIAFMACKGGTGATFLATGLAHMAASALQQPCVLIDLDLLYGDASFYLGCTGRSNTLADLLVNPQRMDPVLMASCMHAVVPGLQILPSPACTGQTLQAQAEQIGQLLALARREHRLVVVDVPRSMDAASLQALKMADVVCLVTDSSLAALRDTQRCLHLLEAQGCTPGQLHIVLNQVEQGQDVSPETVEATLGMAVHHRIPRQSRVAQECIHLGRPVGALYPDNPVSQSLRETAARLLQMPLPARQGWLSRWLSFPSVMRQTHTPGASRASRSA